MRITPVIFCSVVVACGIAACGERAAPMTTSTGGGTGGGTTSNGGSTVDGGTTIGVDGGSSLLEFAAFGDCRPPSPNDTAGYPSSILSSIFEGARSTGAQFVVGTGDYLFADSASAVDAQLALFLDAQSKFAGPVYHALGNHECNGYTSSNCPDGDETPNIRAFLSKLVPSGVTTPWYRVDVPTPLGNARFLFVAANAWSTAQEDWLRAELADTSPRYTFFIRHEPPGSSQAPGVSPSDALLRNARFTLALYGHTHTYRRIDDQHVISGNAGAPLSSGSSYGYLIVQQKSDGNLTVTEYDAASRAPLDSWTVTPDGQGAP